jgi:hypothetical protein
VLQNHENESSNDDSKNTARIGRDTTPFLFWTIWGIFVLPVMLVLLIAAGVSIPIAAVARHLSQRREARFTKEMKAVGRWIWWGGAGVQVTGRGTFIEEYRLGKEPYRLWWTSEDIAEISPRQCCFEEMPWEFEDDGFFDWCGRRFIDPVSGTAAIVDESNFENKEVIESLAEIRTHGRCVSIRTLFFNEQLDERETKS